MTTLAPSREEQAEISRFGIFDEDVLRELAERGDDAIDCANPYCEETATHVWAMLPCRHSYQVCAACADGLSADLAKTLDAGVHITCRVCGSTVTGAEVRPL